MISISVRCEHSKGKVSTIIDVGVGGVPCKRSSFLKRGCEVEWSVLSLQHCAHSEYAILAQSED